MSADIRYFKNDEKKISLDVSVDAEFLSDLINYEQGTYCEIYVEFFSDQGLTIPVTPTAGTINVTASPLGNVFLKPSGSQQIQAVDVAFPDGTYSPIIIDGLITRAKISVTGIAGASYMKAVIFNHI